MQALTANAQGNSTEVLAADLSQLMKHLLVNSSSEFFAAVEARGLSFTQVKALAILSDAEAPLSVKALSDRLGLSLPAVSRAVDALVRSGQVKRDEDPADRRCKRVSPTARGRRTFDQLAAIRVAEIKRFVQGLERDERDSLAAALRPVVEAIE